MPLDRHLDRRTFLAGLGGTGLVFSFDLGCAREEEQQSQLSADERSEARLIGAAINAKMDYRGWLDDDSEFDSSYKRGESISFPLNGVIPGWTEGMQLVGTGGMIELTIPPALGYGARGAGAAVPPNATLHFIVELHDVK